MMRHVPHPRRDITARISQEYQEMPGLQLTLVQAVRLFDTDPYTVEAALDRLVASSVLRHIGAFYVRADLGRRSA